MFTIHLSRCGIYNSWARQMWGLLLSSAAVGGKVQEPVKRNQSSFFVKKYYKALDLIFWQPGLGRLPWASYGLVGYGFDNDWMQKE